MTCNDTGDSNRCLTIDIFDRVIFPYLKVQEGSRGPILLEDFKSHSTPETKEHVKSFKSGAREDDDEDRHELVDSHMMSGGIAPKGQPVDLFVDKVTKGHYRSYYDLRIIDAPMNPTTGHPLIPSRQLCAIWLAKAWEQVPEIG